MGTSTTPAEGKKRQSRARLWLAVAAVVGVALVMVLVVFQPHKLFIDDRVDEALPVAAGEAPASTTAGAASTSPPAPVIRHEGWFISRDHGTSGVARVLDVGGVSYLRIEDLDTDNGPDLYVYLTANPADGPEESFDDDIVDLGRLKGNVGNQNYELPLGLDVTRYRTVVIWCDRFDAAFGAADLTDVRPTSGARPVG